MVPKQIQQTQKQLLCVQHSHLLPLLSKFKIPTIKSNPQKILTAISHKD
jgi:hypothetical protein